MAKDTDNKLIEDGETNDAICREPTTPNPCSQTDVLTSDQLMDLFRSYKRFETENITVGFIGYPNVGKSSTINKLLSSKKVILF